MEYVNYVLILIGIYSIIVGAINPGFTSRKQVRMANRIGEGRARLFYAVLGILFILLGIFI